MGDSGWNDTVVAGWCFKGAHHFQDAYVMTMELIEKIPLQPPFDAVTPRGLLNLWRLAC